MYTGQIPISIDDMKALKNSNLEKLTKLQITVRSQESGDEILKMISQNLHELRSLEFITDSSLIQLENIKSLKHLQTLIL